MNRREFLASTAAAAAVMSVPLVAGPDVIDGIEMTAEELVALPPGTKVQHCVVRCSEEIPNIDLQHVEVRHSLFLFG